MGSEMCIRDRLYTIQALWSAAHYRIPVVIVILNNTSYRILKQRLLALRGHAEQADTFVGMELTDPTIDFIGLDAQRTRAPRPCTRQPT